MTLLNWVYKSLTLHHYYYYYYFDAYLLISIGWVDLQNDEDELLPLFVISIGTSQLV